MRYIVTEIIVCTLALLPAAAGRISVAPSELIAGRGAVVSIAGTSDACAAIITHREAKAAGKTLTLSAAFASNPAADCLPGPVPFSADFELPPLDSGAYTVLLDKLPECAYSAAPCPFAKPVPDTGSLSVRNPDPLPYRLHLEPALVMAGSPHTVVLRGLGFACGDVLTGKGATVEGGAVYLSYSLAHTDRMCVDTLFLGDEAFELPALSVGAYPVHLAPRNCDGPGRLCGQAATAQAIDTLRAVETAGLRPGREEDARFPGADGPLTERIRGVRYLWKGRPVTAAGRSDPAP